MYSSDKEDIIKNKLPTDKPKRDEKYPEVEETAETYQEEFIQDTLVSSSVKRKSEPYFENQRKRRANNVRKESDENLTDYANSQHTVLAGDHSKKNGKHLIPVTLPCIRISSVEEDSKQADQAITQEENIEKLDETDSVINAIKASISKYFTSASDQCGSDGSKPLLSTNNVCTISNQIINILENLKEEIIVKKQIGKIMSENKIQSKCSQICVSSKDSTKAIDENLRVKEEVADEKETSKFEASEETCTNCKQRFYIPVIAPGKRKFDETVEDKKRKRSAGNDENLTDSLNVQDTALYPDLLKKQENHLVNTVVSIDGTAEVCVKEQDIAINKTDQSLIKCKITETTTEADFQTHEIQISKNASQSDQTQSSEKVLLLEDTNVRSTGNRSIPFVQRSLLSSFFDNVKDGINKTPNEIWNESTSRIQDSKHEVIETENLRKFWNFIRITDNAPTAVKIDEKLTNRLIVQDSGLYGCNSKKHEKHLVNTVVSIKDAAERWAKKKNIAMNQTDQSLIKYKMTEIANEADFQTREIETSKYANTPDQTQSIDNVLQIEDADVSSTENRSISFVERSSLSSKLDNVKEGGIINRPNESRDESTSEDRLKYSKTEDMPNENSSKFWDFHENPEPEFPKEEDKLVKFPSKMSNIKPSCDISLQMSQTSAGTSKSEVLISRKSHEDAPLEESMPQQGIIGGHLYRSSSRLSPVKLFSDSGCDLNSIYIELESNIINLEHMENTEFIESQRQILESISQQQRLSTMMPEFDDEKGKLPTTFENKEPEEVGPEVSIDAALRVYVLYQILVDVLKSNDHNPENLSELELIYMLTGLAVTHDPVSMLNIPYIIKNYRECMRQSPAAMKIAYEKSMNERFENKYKALNPVTLVDGFPDTLPFYVNPKSPGSSIPENVPDNNSETDCPEFREYRGLSKDPNNVKKDARYQKKFYKQKNSVILPINQSGGSASVSEIEPNIDSEENRMQVNDDDPRIETGNSEGSIHEEKYQEHLSILLENKVLLKKKSEDTLSAEDPTKVKKDSRYQKSIYALTPVILPINESKDGGSSEIKPNVDFDKNEIQRIISELLAKQSDYQRIVSRKSEDSVHEESEYLNVLLKEKDMFKETGISPENKLSGASAIASEYKISSFMDESPSSSQSNSSNINKESRLPSMVEVSPQLKGIAERSTSIASKIPSSQDRPSQSNMD